MEQWYRVESWELPVGSMIVIATTVKKPERRKSTVNDTTIQIPGCLGRLPLFIPRQSSGPTRYQHSSNWGSCSLSGSLLIVEDLTTFINILSHAKELNDDYFVYETKTTESIKRLSATLVTFGWKHKGKQKEWQGCLLRSGGERKILINRFWVSREANVCNLDLAIYNKLKAPMGKRLLFFMASHLYRKHHYCWETLMKALNPLERRGDNFKTSVKTQLVYLKGLGVVKDWQDLGGGVEWHV